LIATFDDGRWLFKERTRTVRPHLSHVRSTGRELWQWTQIDWGPSHGPNGGVADSLDEAKAAFRAAWERRPQLSQTQKFPQILLVESAP
jgi:hypothetical protein